MFEKLKKVTPKALRVYKKAGLLDMSNMDNLVDSMLDVMVDEKRLVELVEVTFDHDFSDVDIDEIDLAGVMEGIQRFLLQLHANLKKL